MVKALVKDVLIMISGIGAGCVFCIKSKEEKAAIVVIVLKKSRKRLKLIIVRENYRDEYIYEVIK